MEETDLSEVRGQLHITTLGSWSTPEFNPDQSRIYGLSIGKDFRTDVLSSVGSFVRDVLI